MPFLSFPAIPAPTHLLFLSLSIGTTAKALVATRPWPDAYLVACNREEGGGRVALPI
jgi:hypothetical protein